MGSGQVVSTIVEWAAAALRDHPLLVAPTLVLALGVVGLAVFEAATLTVEVVTLMVRHYRHRLSELSQAFQDLRGAISAKTRTPLKFPETDSTRSSVVQRDRLAQQQLFDRRAK